MKDQKSEWESLLDEKLSFLGERKVMGAYLLILSMAKSQRDIEHLHGLLPANCQVSGDDLGVLRKIRYLMYDGKPISRGQRLPDEVCRELLRKALGGKTLVNYYTELLVGGRKVWRYTFAFGAVPHRICAYVHKDSEGIGPVSECFSSSLFGKDIEVHLFLSSDNTTIAVSLKLWSFDLTQEFVRSVLRNETLKNSEYSGLRESGGRGLNIDFCFPFSAGPFLGFLDDSNSEHPVIKEGFVDLLQSKLAEIGLDSSILGPVIPARLLESE